MDIQEIINKRDYQVPMVYQDLEKMEAAIQDSDWETVVDLAHSIYERSVVVVVFDQLINPENYYKNGR